MTRPVLVAPATARVHHSAPLTAEHERDLEEASGRVTAHRLVSELSGQVRAAPSFSDLDPAARRRLLDDLQSIEQALVEGDDPYARPFEDEPVLPWTRRRGQPAPARPAEPQAPDPTATATPRSAATETLAARAGALSDEIDFAGFVAGLVHGTFDAIVNASIRQMEAFADLVSAIAKDVDSFTRENVTTNQARDYLVDKHPADLRLMLPGQPGSGQPRVERRTAASDDDDELSPAWLADYGLAGQELTDELIEEQLVPAARRSVAESRLQLLATMVLLGMNRINVRDGRISARVRFRAKATDTAAVDYAVSSDPGTSGWGDRGSTRYADHSTMISTVGANVQTETDLKVELFGQVEINFVSETLPLERFADEAQLALVQRHTRAAAYRPPAANVAQTPAIAAPVVGPAQPAPAAPVDTPVSAAPASTPPVATDGGT